jgi:hypothetical protein
MYPVLDGGSQKGVVTGKYPIVKFDKFPVHIQK